MIEKVMKIHLDKHLDVPVLFEHQDDLPERYIILEKTGGRKKNHLSSSTFAIQSYAESMFEAANLNQKVKAALEKIIESDSVVSIQLNADYNFTDVQSKKYRYQAVFDINHY